MPIVNGDYEKLSEAEIRAALETEFQTEFGQDIDLTESSVFTTLAQVLAATLNSNQEQSLKEVYESAFLETATGENLEKVVAIIGLVRRSAIHATGVQRFISDQPVETDHTIQAGTVVQTDSDNPLKFETTTTSNLSYVTGFENQDTSNLDGDTGSTALSFNTTDPYDGSAALELGATSGVHVWHDSETVRDGDEYRLRVQTAAGGVPVATFAVQDADNYYQLAIDEPNGELRIEKVEAGSVSQTIDSNAGLTIPTGTYLDVEIDWRINGDIQVEVRDDNEGGLGEDDATVVGTVAGADSDSDRWRSGLVGFKSDDATAAKQFDESSTAATSADIRAVRGGVQGNVGAASLTILPSPPSGVDSTTNVFPTGNTNYVDLTDSQFIIGKNEETDSELRERAQESVSSGGDATHDAMVNSLLNDVDAVNSVTVFENKTDTDNTGTGGLPPHSFEAVVFGGDDKDVARAIFETKAITSRDYAGANGTAVTETVTSEANNQQFNIDFSRPTKLDVDLSMDLVVDDTYIGDEEVANLIVEYVGGIRVDGTEAVGLGVGQDVRIDRIEDIVVGDDTGVIGFDTTASTEDVTTTPAKTTDSNGLEIVDVGANEVAQTNASDGSITINTTEI